MDFNAVEETDALRWAEGSEATAGSCGWTTCHSLWGRLEQQQQVVDALWRSLQMMS